MVGSESLSTIPMMFYAEWYRKDVAPNLTKEQKEKLLMKLSDLSLKRPIHLPNLSFSKKDFPELEPFMHTAALTGLQLYAVMCELFEELHPKQSKGIGKPYPNLPERKGDGMVQ